jgi:hypothetical protein
MASQTIGVHKVEVPAAFSNTSALGIQKDGALDNMPANYPNAPESPVVVTDRIWIARSGEFWHF